MELCHKTDNNKNSVIIRIFVTVNYNLNNYFMYKYNIDVEARVYIHVMYTKYDHYFYKRLKKGTFWLSKN